jgi:hypothetical protein
MMKNIVYFGNLGYSREIADKVKTSRPDRNRVYADSVFGPEERILEKARNERSVKLLKIHNTAKLADFATNDFNDLQPRLRNVSFRPAKGPFRYLNHTDRSEALVKQSQKVPQKRS